ncbi:MAG: hypothetical protein K9I94_02695 [Bacteroidales bacterium]|nr:hypothetical protein [Bacteroidales bacterium]
MKRTVPIIAMILAILGLLSLVMTFFYESFCVVSLSLFSASVILFIICAVKGCCCVIKEQHEQKLEHNSQ